MAVTENSYTGNGSTTNYSFTFPYLKSTDILVQVDQVTTTAWSLANATTVQFNSAPANGAKIKILRDTNVDNLTATFYAGSAIKSEDLNDNFTQNLYVTQEVGNRSFENTGTSTMIGNLQMGAGTSVVFEGATDDAHEITLTCNDPTSDTTLTLPNVTGTVVTTGNTGIVTSTMISDGTIVNGDIANGTIQGGKLANDTITSTQIAPNAITYSELADNSVSTNHIVAGTIAASDLANAAVVTAKIADNQIDSQHYIDGSIDHEHLSGDCIDADNIQDNAIKSEHYTDNSIQRVHLEADIIDATKIADGQISTEHYVVDSIQHAHLQTDIIDGDNIQDNAVSSEHIGAKQVTLAKVEDINSGQIIVGNSSGRPSMRAVTGDVTISNIGEVTIANTAVEEAMLAAGAVTESKVGNDAITADKLLDHASDDAQRAVTTNHIQDNAVTIAKLGCEETTLTTNSDVKVPTSKAVADHVANVVDSVGGFKIVANKDSFPEAHPDPKGDAGMVISVTDPAGFVINGSGVSTTGDTITSDGTVTINGFPSDVHSTTTTSNYTLLLQTTSTAHTYDFYRFLAKDADVLNLSDDIQDFGNRYRTGANRTANNSNTNHDGDLFFDQTANKMYVYDGAYDSGGSWKEVTSTGEFKILTIVNTGQSHDGTLTVDGNQDDYDLFDGTNAASITQAAQLTVSLNGVIQKPNSGTFSGSAEGFYLEGSNGIKFCDPPPANSSIFVTQSGSAVTLSVPADDSVTAAKINAGTETTGHFLQKSASGSGLVWAAAADSDKIEKFDSKVEVSDTDGNNAGKISFYIDNGERARIDGGLFIADGFPIRLGDIGGTYTNSLQLSGNTSTDHSISSGYRDIKFEAGGVNNNVNTSHDWMKLVHSPASGTTATKVELYASNVKRLETSTTGVTVTGTVAATAYTGDGSALTGIASTSIGGCGYQNDQEITGTQSIPANKGMHSVGPITNSGTVTVSGRWVIS